MDDLISRQRLLKELKHHKELFCRNRIEFLGLSKNDKARVDELDNCIATVINVPSAQPERCEDCENFNKTRLLIPQPERKKGKWIDDRCSECGCYVYHGDVRNFCPNCGADMREENT